MSSERFSPSKRTPVPSTLWPQAFKHAHAPIDTLFKKFLTGDINKRTIKKFPTSTAFIENELAYAYSATVKETQGVLDDHLELVSSSSHRFFMGPSTAEDFGQVFWAYKLLEYWGLSAKQPVLHLYAEKKEYRSFDDRAEVAQACFVLSYTLSGTLTPVQYRKWYDGYAEEVRYKKSIEHILTENGPCFPTEVVSILLAYV